MRRGMLIIDRGSKEREASEELEAICEEIRGYNNYEFVDFCFLEVIPPFIEDGMRRALSKGVDYLTIVPYFLYPGRKVKAAVTDAMKYQGDTDTRLVVTRPMSMHQSLIDTVEDRISSALKKSRVTLQKSKVDVLIIGHGSKDPNAHMSIKYVVDGLAKVYRNVGHCFLEIEQPDIAAGIKQCKNNDPKVLVIVFYFLHEGAHVKTDIYADLNPALEEAGMENVIITKHLGADNGMVELVMARAREVEDAD